MYTSKFLLATFVIAAGGLFNAADREQVGVLVPAVDTQGDSAVVAVPPPRLETALAALAEAALLAEVRKDLSEPAATVRLQGLRFAPVGSRTLEGRGSALVLLHGAGTMPVKVTLTSDIVDARVEHVAYRVSGNTGRSRSAVLGAHLRSQLAQRIQSRLAVEFDQPVDFALLDIEQVASGRSRLTISGNGISRFPGEGAAYTRFVATADRFSGEIHGVTYELLQEVDEASATRWAGSLPGGLAEVAPVADRR